MPAGAGTSHYAPPAPALTWEQAWPLISRVIGILMTLYESFVDEADRPVVYAVAASLMMGSLAFEAGWREAEPGDGARPDLAPD